MEWLNIHVSKLDSPEFLGSEPVDRATWVCLQRFCAGQENGGRIEACHEWKDRKWQQLVGITEHESRRACDLWKWEGNDLVLWGYDCEKEAEVVAKREGGREGGRSKSDAKKRAAKENGKRGGRPENPSLTQAKHKDETQAQAKLKTKAKPKLNPTEGNGREGKGMEGKGLHSQTSSSSVRQGPPAESVTGGDRQKPDGDPPDIAASDVPPCSLDQALSVAAENAIPAEAARKWWLEHDARGWTDRSGNRVLRWQSSLVAYGASWRDIESKSKNTQNHANHRPGSNGGDRNRGTLNEGRCSQYRGLGKPKPDTKPKSPAADE